VNKYNTKYKLLSFTHTKKIIANISLLATGRTFSIPLEQLVLCDISDDLSPSENREIYRKIYSNNNKNTIYDIKDKKSKYWLTYTTICLFLTSLVIFCTVSGIKPVEIKSLNLIIPAAIFAYPVSFILVDILNEFFGLKLARAAIISTFFVNIVFCISLWLVGLLPSIAGWELSNTFSQMTISIISVLVASSVSFIISENINAYLLFKIKELTKSKFLFLRVITSTVTASAIDSILFITIVFYGKLDIDIIKIMILTQFLIKTSYAVIGIFPIYASRWAFNKYINIK
jgi:queuosine precursor transporter